MANKNKYFDLQVNGYKGVNFNDNNLTLDQLHQTCLALQADDVQGILATIITDKLDDMAIRISNIVKYRQQDELIKKVIVGLHIEGPFINEIRGYVGAHPPDAVLPATPDAMQKLLDAAEGLVKIVTLAPERDANFATISMLAKQGITVSAGHCNPTLDQLKAAIDVGLSMFTHLGNGCPMEMNRHENIIQRVLSLSDQITPCFIADGAHIQFPALSNYIRCVGIERAVVITDANTPAGLGPGTYTMGRWGDIKIGEDLAIRAPDGSHLLGSAMIMPKVESNLKNELGLTEQQVKQLTYINPRKAIGLN